MSKKIIRAVTVDLSCGFFREVMIKMREMGYEMVALTSPGPNLTALHDEDGFRTIEVQMERHISPLKDFVSLCKMIKTFRKEKPDVIHSMTPKAGLLCMIAGWFTRVPVRIHTFTGLVWPTSTGTTRKILMTTDRITCACATHVIPEGQGVLNDLKNHGVCKKPMKVLGYGNIMGVDLQRFDASRFKKRESDGTFRFLFVGRMVGDKGINELIEAFTRLHQNHPNVRLVLVGNYERDLDPLKAETEAEIANNEAITYVGTKAGDNLLQEYVDADCFVMPSYREGFPNTVIEAGAMSLPSIVTDINGSREIVQHNKTGIIVPSKDADALLRAMERVVTDDTLRQSLASAARPLIASRFDKEFVQRCIIDFYKEVMN